MPAVKFAKLSLLLAVVTALSGCLPQAEAMQEHTETFTVTAPPSLTFDIDNGRVTVHGQPGLDQVRIRAQIHAFAGTEREAEALLDDIPLKITQTGNQVQIQVLPNPTLFPFGKSYKVNFEVTVPQQTELTITTDNGNVRVDQVWGNLKVVTDNGNIHLDGVQGDMDLTTDNGNIAVDHALGSLHAETDNGNIDFSGRLTGPSHRVTTDNGNITLSLPTDSRLRVDARVDRGRISSELPLEGLLDRDRWNAVINSADATLTLRTDNGNITLQSNNSAP